jgi:hypothetical protein
MAEYRNDDRNRRLFYLHDLDDYKVAKDHPDVRGWKVVDSEKKKIGEVESLLVDIKAEKVRYLDVDLDQDILHDRHNPYEKSHKDGIHEYANRKGETHMIIPIGVARIDRNAKMIIADGINMEALTNAPTHEKGAVITRDHEINVISSYSSEDKKDEKIRMKDEYFYDQDCFDDACLYEQGYQKNRNN